MSPCTAGRQRRLLRPRTAGAVRWFALFVGGNLKVAALAPFVHELQTHPGAGHASCPSCPGSKGSQTVCASGANVRHHSIKFTGFCVGCNASRLAEMQAVIALNEHFDGNPIQVRPCNPNPSEPKDGIASDNLCPKTSSASAPYSRSRSRPCLPQITGGFAGGEDAANSSAVAFWGPIRRSVGPASFISPARVRFRNPPRGVVRSNPMGGSVTARSTKAATAAAFAAVVPCHSSQFPIIAFSAIITPFPVCLPTRQSSGRRAGAAVSALGTNRQFPMAPR